MSLTTSKKPTQMMGPEITAAASKAFERGQNNKLTTHGCQLWSAGGTSGGCGSLQPITHRLRDGSQTKRGRSQTQG